MFEDIAEAMGKAAMATGVVFLLSLLFAVPDWLLWNWLCPMIWGWPELTLMQAWGLSLLCGLLFKSVPPKSKS